MKRFVILAAMAAVVTVGGCRRDVQMQLPEPRRPASITSPALTGLPVLRAMR